MNSNLVTGPIDPRVDAWCADAISGMRYSSRKLRHADWMFQGGLIEIAIRRLAMCMFDKNRDQFIACIFLKHYVNNVPSYFLGYVRFVSEEQKLHFCQSLVDTDTREEKFPGPNSVELFEKFPDNETILLTLIARELQQVHNESDESKNERYMDKASFLMSYFVELRLKSKQHAIETHCGFVYADTTECGEPPKLGLGYVTIPRPKLQEKNNGN